MSIRWGIPGLLALLLAASSGWAKPVEQALRAPLRFEPNRGQSDPQVRFLARGAGYGMYLTDHEAVMSFQSQAEGAAAPAVLRLTLEGSTPARPHGRLPQPGRSHYLSLDPGKAPVVDLPHYSEVVQRARYPGIDVAWYGNDGQVEYDFVLAPQADPDQIAIAIDGADGLSVAADGDLHIALGGRILVQRAPVAFQYADTAVAATPDATRLRHRAAPRIPVTVRYAIGADGRVRFVLGEYDRARPLVIDPVISWATYLGGSLGDFIERVAVDASGNVYAVGVTRSADFPLASALQGSPGGGSDLFVTKLNASGTGLVYSTYLGGANDQGRPRLALTPANQVVVAMQTKVVDPDGDAAVFRLNPGGSALEFSLRVNHSGAEAPSAVALDASGNIVIVGHDSSIFPKVNAPMPAINYSGAFIWKVSAAGATLFSGGIDCTPANNDYPEALAIDSAGNLYIGGWGGHAFVWKLPAAASSCSFNRRVDGAAGNSVLTDLVLDSSGRPLVTGWTTASDFPVVGALQGTPGGDGDAFFARLGTAGGIQYATYLGSSARQRGYAIARDAVDRVHIAGLNDLYDWDPASQTGGDAFLVRLDPQGDGAYTVGYSSTLHSTTGHTEWMGDLAVDSAGIAYLGINTDDGYLPTTAGAVQANGHNFDFDAWLVRVTAETPVVSVGAANIAENGGVLAFPVSVSPRSLGLVEVNYATQAGSASAGSDYTTTQGTLRIPAGSTSGWVYVPVINDSTDEPDETLTLTISSPRGASLGAASAVGTILDDDPAPSISTTDCSVTEGNSGSVQCVFTLTLSQASARTVSVNVQSQPGTASAGDYQALAATAVTFNPGQTSRTVGVVVSGDTLDEPNETFGLLLSLPQNATLGDASGTGTIVDDDLPPVLSVDGGGCSANEGNSGSVACNFVLRLSAPSGFDVQFSSATANGTATAGSDYTGHGATARSIPAGQTTLTIAVPVSGDLIDESDEAFALNIGSVQSATPGSLSASGTIIDDDQSVISIDGGGCSVPEGQAGSSNCNFVLRLSNPSSVAVTFTSATANGTATAGSDYTGHGATARSIPAGQTALSIAVPVLGDTLDEDNETFALNLGSIANATPGSLSATGTITDDDAAPTLSIDNGGCSVTEGNSGSVNCSFVARLSAISGRNVSFTTATANGTATAGSDYTAHSAITRTLAAGNQTLTVLVPVLGDTLDEPNETFALNLTAITNATPGSLAGTGTIVDDDEPVTPGSLRVRDASLIVGENSGSVQVVVERVGGSSGAASVQYATANGSAIAGLDYGAASGTLNWAAGDASAKTVTLSILFDPAAEPQESFALNLSQASGASLGAPASSTVTIIDGTQMLMHNGFE